MYRYKVEADVTLWHKNTVLEHFEAEDTVIAEDEWQAMDDFTSGIKDDLENESTNVDIDDVRCKLLGPADIVISVKLTDYIRIGKTMTVGELVKYLDENFDADANIYLADYNGMVVRYGGITNDSIMVDKEE